MICALEAMVKRQLLEEEEAKRREEKRIRQEQENRENTIFLCEKIIAPMIERRTTSIYFSEWGSFIIDGHEEYNTACLMQKTTEEYKDKRESWKYYNFCNSKYTNPHIDLKVLKEYLNSYCWDFEIEKFKGYRKCWGEVTLRKVKIIPSPSCI